MYLSFVAIPDIILRKECTEIFLHHVATEKSIHSPDLSLFDPPAKYPQIHSKLVRPLPDNTENDANIAQMLQDEEEKGFIN